MAAVLSLLWACGDNGSTEVGPCEAEPVIMTTSEGVEFVRTPDECFKSLPDWPYAAQYQEIDGLRQAYVDEGPADGPVVLLLHGQPSWSYLYRKMIPVLANAGFRVIAMDHLGMGRSDKPTDVASYSYLGHNDRLIRFIEALDLRDINLFVQDWGSLIGLRVAGLNLDRFARIAIGDGDLPVIPADVQPFPPVENPNETEDIESGFAQIPAQQPAFFDGCDLAITGDPGGLGDFGNWMRYAMKANSFRASEVLEGLTWFDLPIEEEAAYDAPFPSRIYMAGPRVFPSLINDVPGTTAEAWAALSASDIPLVTLWASNDPGNLGSCDTQNKWITSMPGAAGVAHARFAEASHFLQDDQGGAIAQRLVGFFSDAAIPLTRGSRYCEILLARMDDSGINAEVWGSQYLNECPAAQWDALDTDAIQADTGALAVIKNGPRQWLTHRILGGNAGGPSSVETMSFGGIPMNLLATVQANPSQQNVEYMPVTVSRTTTYYFDVGTEIYELTDPDGEVYVMQAMSQAVDAALTLGDLPGLAARLTLPTDWTYAVQTLSEPLIMTTKGSAIVVTDELENTYQRLRPADDEPGGLPVLEDGTGTVCTMESDCAGLDASHCISSADGGFCTIEGCTAGGCGDPYLCCRDCDEAFAAMLPFEGSACVPPPIASQLTGIPACTCD